MRIRRVKASNFGIYGQNGLDVDFDSIGNGMVRVVGAVSRSGDPDARDNGAGKSTVFSAIYYGLTGDALRRRRRKKVAALVRKSRKGSLAGPMTVELFVDDLKIVRGRNPNVFEVYCDPNLVFPKESIVDQAKDLQQWVEDRLGTNDALFRNTSIFDPRNSDPFMSADTKERRQIIEMLLGLDKWSAYLEETRKRLKDARASYKEAELALGAAKATLTVQAGKREEIADAERKWALARDQRMANIANTIRIAADVDPATVIAAHDAADAYERYVAQASAADRLIASSTECLNASINTAKSYLERAAEFRKTADSFRDRARQFRASISATAACEACGQPIPQEKVQARNVAAELKAAEAESAAESADAQAISMTQQAVACSGQIEQLKAKLDAATAEKAMIVHVAKVERPQMTRVEAQAIAQRISSLQEEYARLRDEPSPYLEQARKAIADVEATRALVSDAEARLKSCDASISTLKHWEAAFGDEGIRSYIVKSMIPQLTARVNYWLDIVSGGSMSIEFDESLDAKVFIDGDEADIDMISNGEEVRIDIAVYFAFADIMRGVNKADSNLLLIDEVGGNALDSQGKVGLFSALEQMSASRTVMLITHDQVLGSLADAGARVVVRHAGGVAFAEVEKRDLRVDEA